MNVAVLVVIGVLSGLTTVLFGFGGGFVTVPVIVWADRALGAGAAEVAVATSAAVMVINSAVATAATSREIRALLRGATALLVCLGIGGIVGAALARFAPAPVTTWGFVVYVLATVADVLLRPGFLRPAEHTDGPERQSLIPAALGAPIGALAAFLGVGGSVMTVPLLRRTGHPMNVATALANPLTLAISLPSLAVFLMSVSAAHPNAGIPVGFLVGVVDIRAAAALLVGAMPIIVWLRRRPLRLPDQVHAWAYIALLVISALAMGVSAIG